MCRANPCRKERFAPSAQRERLFRDMLATVYWPRCAPRKFGWRPSPPRLRRCSRGLARPSTRLLRSQAAHNMLTRSSGAPRPSVKNYRRRLMMQAPRPPLHRHWRRSEFARARWRPRSEGTQHRWRAATTLLLRPFARGSSDGAQPTAWHLTKSFKKLRGPWQPHQPAPPRSWSPWSKRGVTHGRRRPGRARSPSLAHAAGVQGSMRYRI